MGEIIKFPISKQTTRTPAQKSASSLSKEMVIARLQARFMLEKMRTARETLRQDLVSLIENSGNARDLEAETELIQDFNNMISQLDASLSHLCAQGSFTLEEIDCSISEHYYLVGVREPGHPPRPYTEKWHG